MVELEKLFKQIGPSLQALGLFQGTHVSPPVLGNSRGSGTCWLPQDANDHRTLQSLIPWWLSCKVSTCNSEDAGDSSSIPDLGRSPGGGHGNPFQYSCLENPMDRGAWQMAKSRTRLKQLEHTCTPPGSSTGNRTVWHGSQCHLSFSSPALVTPRCPLLAA